MVIVWINRGSEITAIQCRSRDPQHVFRSFRKLKLGIKVLVKCELCSFFMFSKYDYSKQVGAGIIMVRK